MKVLGHCSATWCSLNAGCLPSRCPWASWWLLGGRSAHQQLLRECLPVHSTVPTIVGEARHVDMARNPRGRTRRSRSQGHGAHHRVARQWVVCGQRMLGLCWLTELFPSGIREGFLQEGSSAWCGRTGGVGLGERSVGRVGGESQGPCGKDVVC